ncbi:MAG: AzlC family ABC transporter permease [Gemmobacter sp.]
MADVPFTAAGFRRGVRAGLPLGVSILVYGLAFGLIAAQAGFGITSAVVTSAAIYSGSAQLAAVNLIQSGQATLATLAAAILVINARYVLFSAALRPWLGQTTPLRAYGSLLLLGDANWLVTMKAIEAGEADRAYLAGTGAPMVVAWLAGTALGVGAVGVLPSAHVLGFDLMLAAFAAAMMTAMVKVPLALVSVAVGAGAALLIAMVAGPSWGIIAAGLAGGAVAAAMWRPQA